MIDTNPQDIILEREDLFFMKELRIDCLCFVVRSASASATESKDGTLGKLRRLNFEMCM